MGASPTSNLFRFAWASSAPRVRRFYRRTRVRTIRFVLRIEPGINVTLAKAQAPAQIEAGGQGAAVAVAVVEGLYGKSCEDGQVFEGE